MMSLEEFTVSIISWINELNLTEAQIEEVYEDLYKEDPMQFWGGQIEDYLR